LKEVVNDLEGLRAFLKEMIIETLKLEDVTAEEIGNDSPLFGDGLGLDSIDALELVVAIEKHFDVIIEDEDVGKRAFASIDALCEFIREQTVGG